MEIKYDSEQNDYETINGHLYIRAGAVADVVMGSPNFTDDGEADFLEQDLGITKDGVRF